MADSETTVRRLRSTDVDAVSRLPDLLVGLGCEVEGGLPQVVDDLYLDTEDWWLYRAGAACRLSRSAEGTTLALEPVRACADVHTTAADLEERLPGPPPTFPAPIPGEHIANRLVPLIGHAPVRDRVHLERARTVLRAVTATGIRLEAMACMVRLSRGDVDRRFAEVELDITGGSTTDRSRLVDRVAEALEMEVTEASSLTAALELAGIEPPRLVEGDDLALRETDRSVDAAYRVLRRHFNRMRWNEPGTRLGLDAECLHDMRVATRRLRSALRVFRGSLPERRHEGLRRDLRWLGATLGAVRDLDVYLLHLDEEAEAVDPDLRPALGLYAADLRKRRARARAKMLKVLETSRYAAFVARFDRFLAAGPPRTPAAAAAAAPVTEAARRVILKRLRQVLRGGRALTPRSPDRDLHQLRIRCKRLRYACEFFADICGPVAEAFAKRVTFLQDLLGAHQDAVVARATLSSFVPGISAPRERIRTLYMAVGQLTMVHARRARRAREQFFKAWKRFDRKQIRRPLQACLDRFRPASRPAPPVSVAGPAAAEEGAAP